MDKQDLKLPHSERVCKWGHRRYTGGGDDKMWYGIGKRQYHFLVAEGLRNDMNFLDVACGGLRLGQFLIPALDTGNYYGLEAEEGLVTAGIDAEILFDVLKVKKPKFAFNYTFDVSFCDGYDFAIAQSLFTHLTPEDISNCFAALRSIARNQSKFFFTFHKGSKARNRYNVSHANRRWRYSFEDLAALADASGFECTYIGGWGHERGQVIAVATPR